MSFRQRILLPVTVILLSGCASTPLPSLPESDVPDAWLGPLNDGADAWPAQDWWNSFGSDELSELIALVEEKNLDLANNQRNLEAAQIALRNAGFDLYPTPVLEVGAAQRYAGAKMGGGDFSDGGTRSADLSLGIVYTDILSKPAAYDAAVSRYDSNVALAADIRLNTLGTTASTYFRILLLRDRIDAARMNLKNAEQIAEIVDARVRAGTVTPIDGLQQRIAVQQQENNIRSLVQDELAARSSLALLVAESVNDVVVDTTTLEGIFVPQVQPGLPAELLVRRPDIVQAEASLRLSRANVDLVRTAFIPNISLTGSASLIGDSLGDVFTADNALATASASIVQTLLDNGSRRRNLASSKLDLENSLADYRKTVIAAFNEIEVSLANIQLLDVLGQFAVDDLARAEEAFRISEVRYREGVDEYQTVLTTQNTLFSVRNNYYDNMLARLNAIISFYQALGGGWSRDAGVAL
jgi:NodT family efflux transporter outer membrane factor (OMF) lipoprotein